MKPIFINPERIRPLPEATWNTHCDCCKRPVARWDVLLDLESVSKWTPVCALCWLYASPWGTERLEQLEALVAEVERAAGTTFARTGEGKLARHADADRILGSIALTSRIFHQADKRTSWR